jgi:hypothetical protein
VGPVLRGTFCNILIQQPESSGSEAGEPRVRNKVREILPTKRLTHALCGSKLKLSPGVGDCGNRNADETTLAPVVGFGGVCFWRECGVSRSVLCWLRNLASVAMKMFSHWVRFVKKFCGFGTFTAICKDNAAINCVLLQHRKVHFVKFDCCIMLLC